MGLLWSWIQLRMRPLALSQGCTPDTSCAYGSQTPALPLWLQKRASQICPAVPFGMLVRAKVDADPEPFVRHIHPNECLALNAMDPTLDFGIDVRLTLSGGQIASPGGMDVQFPCNEAWFNEVWQQPIWCSGATHCTEVVDGHEVSASLAKPKPCICTKHELPRFFLWRIPGLCKVPVDASATLGWSPWS